MIRPLLLCGLLLLAGIILVDSYEPHSNTPTQAPSSTKSPKPSNTTTQAPSNTTTQVPSNTTTQAPSNTTTQAPSNTTTQAPSNTTTQAPSNTTTQAPSKTTTQATSNTTTQAPSNTTTHPTTQPSPTLPTKPTPPSSGNYSVRTGNDLCIIADMGLSLELDLKKEKRFFDVDPRNTLSNGTCGDSKANLFLSFNEGSINFVFVKEKKIYYISEVSVIFSSQSAGKWNTTTTGKLKLLSTDIGYSVKCKNTPTVKLSSDMQLTMVDVKLQAFEIHNDSFGKEKVCYPDRNKLLVPVGVALAIVGLILIIILLFLLLRRKQRSGYERL